MQMSSLCDYIYEYILVIGTITITEPGADDNAKRRNERDKGVFKNCMPCIDCISKITLKYLMRKIWTL